VKVTPELKGMCAEGHVSTGRVPDERYGHYFILVAIVGRQEHAAAIPLEAAEN